MEKKEIISEELIGVLVCPICKGNLKLTNYHNKNHGLKCSGCKKIFPIKEGIAIMLQDKAINIIEK